MCEVLERKDRRSDLQYDPGEPEDIIGSLMKLSELSLHDFLAGEPDIYTVDDLKVRYAPRSPAPASNDETGISH